MGRHVALAIAAFGVAGWAIGLRWWWLAARARRDDRARSAWCAALKAILEAAPGTAQPIPAQRVAWAMWGAAKDLYDLERFGDGWYARSPLRGFRLVDGAAAECAVTAPVEAVRARA